MKFKSFLLVFCLILTVNLVYAASYHPFEVRTGFPNKDFYYTFNYTTNADCTGVLLSYSDDIWTDKNGNYFFNIDISSFEDNEIPNYFCEYKNGALRKTHKFSDLIFNSIRVNSIFAHNISVFERIVMNGNPIENASHIQYDPNGNGCGDLEYCTEVDPDNRVLVTSLPGGEVMLQNGQEILLPRSRNDDSGTIYNGQVVYINNATGGNPLVKLVNFSNYRQVQAMSGIVTETSIGVNQPGYYTAFGVVRELDTSSCSDGGQVYGNPLVPGNWTCTFPGQQYPISFIGIVLRSHSTEGEIWFNPQYLQAIWDLSFVDETNINEYTYSILQYDNSTGLMSYTDSPIFENHYNKTLVDELVGGMNLDFFFHNESSGISDYFLMEQTDSRPENTSSFLISADNTPLGSFITQNASTLGITGLASGVVTGHFHANVNQVTGFKTVEGFYELYIRYGNGTEVKIATSETSDVDSTTEEQYEAHAIINQDYSLNNSDRILIKLFANISGTGSNPTLSVHIQGTTASRLEIATTGVNFATKSDLEDYWKSDGTSTATGNWDLGSYNFSAFKFFENGSPLNDTYRALDNNNFSGEVRIENEDTFNDTDLVCYGVATDRILVDTSTTIPDTGSGNDFYIIFNNGSLSGEDFKVSYINNNPPFGTCASGKTIYLLEEHTGASIGDSFNLIKRNEGNLYVENDVNITGSLTAGTLDLDGIELYGNRGSTFLNLGARRGLISRFFWFETGENLTDNWLTLREETEAVGDGWQGVGTGSGLLNLSKDNIWDFLGGKLRNVSINATNINITSNLTLNGTTINDFSELSSSINGTHINVTSLTVTAGDSEYQIKQSTHANVTKLIIEDYFQGSYYGVVYINDSTSYRRVRGNITEYV